MSSTPTQEIPDLAVTQPEIKGFKSAILQEAKDGEEKDSAPCQSIQDFCQDIPSYTPFSAIEKAYYVGPTAHPEDTYLQGIRHYRGYEGPIDYPSAVACFIEAAEKGHLRAQYYLALMTENGQGLPKDSETAAMLYQKCASAILEQATVRPHPPGAVKPKLEAWAVYTSAILYAEGNAGSASDQEMADRLFVKAIPLLEESIQKGIIRAQCSLALALLYLDASAKVSLEVLERNQAAIKNGLRMAEKDSEVQFALGLAYQNGYCGLPENLEQAASCYKKGAEQGDANCQYSFGECCEYGYGVPQHWQTAVIWYDKAAKQNFDPEKFYLRAEDLEKEAWWSGRQARIERFLRWAADQGHAEAQNDLGNLLWDSNNYLEAFRCYELAAAQGVPAAFYNLGSMHRNGKNYSQALMEYKKVSDGYHYDGDDCAGGYGPAQYMVGLLYYEGGHGLPSSDYLQAEIYWLKAINHAHNKQTEAFQSLGLLYKDHYAVFGLTQTEGLVKAACHLKEAAQKKKESAQIHLAVLYKKQYTALGLTQAEGFAKAAYWWRQVIKQTSSVNVNNKEACRQLTVLAPSYQSEQGAYYHKTMALAYSAAYSKMLNSRDRTSNYDKTIALGYSNALSKMLYTNSYTLTEYRAKTNALYLNLFLQDDLLDTATKREVLKEFSLKHYWLKLLPSSDENILKRQLANYLFEIAHETENAKEKERFLSSNMIDPLYLQALKAHSQNVFFKALERIREDLEHVHEGLHTAEERPLLRKIIEWVQDFQELPLCALDQSVPLPLQEQFRLFLEYYEQLIEAADFTVETKAILKSVMVVHRVTQEELSNRYYSADAHWIQKEKRTFFKRILSMRIAAKWSAGMVLYSQDVKHYDAKVEGMEAVIGLAKGLGQCIPFVGAIGEVMHFSHKIFQAIHDNAHLIEVIAGGIETSHLLAEGYAFCEEYIFKHSAQALYNVYANLGIQAAEHIESFCSALCARYEEQIHSFAMGTESELAAFAEDVAKFVLGFLMTAHLTEADKENLPELLMEWCSSQCAGKGSVLKSKEGKDKLKITTGDLLSRTPLVCAYQSNEEEHKEADPGDCVYLGLPQRSKKAQAAAAPKPLDRKIYGSAKASEREVKLFQTQLLLYQAMAASAIPGNCHFSNQQLDPYINHKGVFSSVLVFEPILAVRIKKEKAARLAAEAAQNKKIDAIAEENANLRQVLAIQQEDAMQTLAFAAAQEASSSPSYPFSASSTTQVMYELGVLSTSTVSDNIEATRDIDLTPPPYEDAWGDIYWNRVSVTTERPECLESKVESCNDKSQASP